MCNHQFCFPPSCLVDGIGSTNCCAVRYCLNKSNNLFRNSIGPPTACQEPQVPVESQIRHHIRASEHQAPLESSYDDVSFYNSTASSWTLATPRTTWESCRVIISEHQVSLESHIHHHHSWDGSIITGLVWKNWCEHASYTHSETHFVRANSKRRVRGKNAKVHLCWDKSTLTIGKCSCSGLKC